MKKLFIKIGLLAVIVMIAAGAPAKAQSLQYKITANIPFDFTVADKKLPAGKYSIGRNQLSNGDLVIQISRVRGRESLSRLTYAVVTHKPADYGMLVFHQYGDEYFLFEVWPAGGRTGRAFPKSRSEREAERRGQSASVAQVRF